MHGEEAEVIDGTELAADFTFSGLQKFGQGLEERLRGVKLPIKLLQKVLLSENVIFSKNQLKIYFRLIL